MSQFKIIATTPAAIPAISNPVGENITEPMLPKIGVIFETTALAPVASLENKPPSPAIPVIPSLIPADIFPFNAPINSRNLSCGPFNQSNTVFVIFTLLNVSFTTSNPAKNAKTTLPVDVSNNPASIPENASHMIVPTSPIIVSQSIFARNSPIPLPNPSQSVSCATVLNTPSKLTTKSLRVFPALAQSIP